MGDRLSVRHGWFKTEITGFELAVQRSVIGAGASIPYDWYNSERVSLLMGIISGLYVLLFDQVVQ